MRPHTHATAAAVNKEPAITILADSTHPHRAINVRRTSNNKRIKACALLRVNNPINTQRQRVHTHPPKHLVHASHAMNAWHPVRAMHATHATAAWHTSYPCARLRRTAHPQVCEQVAPHLYCRQQVAKRNEWVQRR